MSDSRLQHEWDFSLTVATVALLGSLGFQSFIGTAYTWWAENTLPGWNETGYPVYVATMNAIAAPQFVLLIVVMGLCVPKRLFARTVLLAVSGGMVLAGLAAWALTGSIVNGLVVFLGLSALIQVAVVAMTVVGARAPSYLTEGRLTKTGSGLLHLGFIVFAIVVVALQRSLLMLPVFWAAATLIIGGTVLAFYADRLAVKRVKRIEVEHTW